MRICIVNNNFNIGGVQKVAIELANSLQQNCHSITLIDFSGKNQFYYKVNKGITIPTVMKSLSFKKKLVRKILFLKSKINRKSHNIYELFKDQTLDLIEYLKKNKHEILIVCQGILTAVIPLIKKEIPNIKIIAWQHNEYEIYVNQYYRHFINEYKLGVEQADKVVCLTHIDKIKFSKLNSNSYYIYNPLTINNQNKNVSTLKEKNIIFVGRLDLKQKGLDYLINLAKNIKDGWRILVAGDGPDKKKFIKMIKKIN